MKKTCYILLLVLLLSTFPLVFGEPSGAPTWANEGINVSYGWELWEYCPAEEVEEKIDMLKINSDLSFVMDLTEFNDTTGIFGISMPNNPSTAVWEYTWEEASWNSDTVLPIYYPDSKLQNASLVDLETALGTYRAYKVETQVTYGQTVRNETYWFEESTHVLLLKVSTCGDTQVDLIVMPLLGTNLWETKREFNVVAGEELFDIVVTSNSTIYSFYFVLQSNALVFNVSGPSQTGGFCELCIPNDLLWGDFTVYKDNVVLVKDVDYTETSNSTHYIFNFTYSHSTHSIALISTEAIPEFTSLILLSTFIAATLFVIISRKRQSKLLC